MADDTNTAERISNEMVHAALKAKNPTLYRDHLRHPSNGPVLSASTENEIQVTRKMLEAAFQAGRASLAASAGSEPLTDSYVQMVPDKCDRIVWRNHYYHLPLDSSTPPSPPEGMAGWKLVPVEPTEEMKTAAVKYANGTAVYKNVKAEVLRIEEGIYGEVYEAMIAAAPQPPASEAKEL